MDIISTNTINMAHGSLIYLFIFFIFVYAVSWHYVDLVKNQGISRAHNRTPHVHDLVPVDGDTRKVSVQKTNRLLELVPEQVHWRLCWIVATIVTMIFACMTGIYKNVCQTLTLFFLVFFSIYASIMYIRHHIEEPIWAAVHDNLDRIK